MRTGRIVKRIHLGVRRRARSVLERAGVMAPKTEAVEPVEAPPQRNAPVSPFAEAVPKPVPQTAETPNSPDAISYDAVQAVLDDMVRPALQSDGGDIELVKVDGVDLYVRLVGACHGCASATVTMRMGVENLLREEFPTMGELIELDSYAMPSGA